MEKVILDWVECSLFLMIASAEATDHYLDEHEIIEIIKKANKLVLNCGKKGVPSTGKDVEQKFKKTFDWYNAIGDDAPEGLMDENISIEVQKAAHYLKDQKWFNETFAKSLITDLIDIAKADGEVIKNEKSSINTIAKLWAVEKPFD